MSKIKVENGIFRDFRGKLAEIKGNKVYDSRGNPLGTIISDKIYDNRNNLVAKVESRYIRDNHNNTLSDVKSVLDLFDGYGDISKIAIWILIIR